MLTTALVAPSLETRVFTGAGEEIRTLDPRLGNYRAVFLRIIYSAYKQGNQGFIGYIYSTFYIQYEDFYMKLPSFLPSYIITCSR